MTRIIQVLLSILVITGLFSCGDTNNIGTSILQDEVVIVMDSSFTASGKSVQFTRIQSRTTTQLLGIIESPEYGQFSSEFVTQFMPASSIDTTSIGVNNIDSLKLIMAVPNGAFVGDSIIPMGLSIYLLDKELPNPIYSDFDPEGYYDPSNVIASEIYSHNAIYEPDSVSSLSYRYITANMPVEVARNLYQAYIDNPLSYQSPAEFIKVFPGIYVTNSFGSGRVVRIGSSVMRMYYHLDGISESTGNDTIFYGYGNYYAVTPEIITNNNIRFTMSSYLTDMIDAGKAIVSAPTGSDVEITFPANDVVNAYKQGSGKISMVNTLSMSIPAITINNSYGIDPPENVLMVLKNNQEEFFNNNDLPDNETSFVASYNATTKSYDFTDMRAYMLWLLNKETITADDYTFIITPVELNMGTNVSGYYGSTTYLESVVPYVIEPAMVELDMKNVKIILTFSRQSVKS